MSLFGREPAGRYLFGRLPEGATLWEPDMALATWFGVGLLPVGPGTWASAVALPFAWVMLEVGGTSLLAVATLAVYLAGIWAASSFIARSGTEDAPEIVIDEITGQWLVLLAAPHTLSGFALAFIVFRVFDTLKPWPVSWADAKIKGGFGAMADDTLAAGLGFCLMALLVWLGQV